tara:strand:+ start:32191 stop:32754 length:564 start_codon:yes stop_codon:yes gene_type:complete
MSGWNEGIKLSLGSCGENVFIGNQVIITQPENVHLGNNVRIDPFTLITSKLKTGDNVQITSHVVISGKDQQVTLGDWTFIGYGSKLFTASEDYGGDHGPVNEFWGDNKIFRGDIEFEDYAGVASDVIVFPGVVLPTGCTVGAQSLIHTKAARELTPWSVWLGNPLRFHKDRNRGHIEFFAANKDFKK